MPKADSGWHIEVETPVMLGGARHPAEELNLSPERPDYVTPDGTQVWIEHHGQRTRFLDRHGAQVGPVHRNLGPAVVWARAQGWRDPALPGWFNDGAIAEVSGGARG